MLAGARFARRDECRVERRGLGWHREVRGPLEHRDVRGLLGDERTRLDARRAGPDDTDPQPAEVDALVGPLAGVEDPALEGTDAVELGLLRLRQTTHCHHTE